MIILSRVTQTKGNSQSTARSPFVSIIIPVYNHEEFVGKAIESALQQNFSEQEVIVVDDGSTDGTRNVVEKFLPAVRYVYKSNGGTSSALNHGIKLARGNFICWLSSDDQFLPTKIHKQVRLFLAQPDLGMVYTDWHETDASGHITRTYHSPPLFSRREAALALTRGNCINGSTVMVKAECFRKLGYFKEHYTQSHDHDMWLRLCRHYRFGHIPEPLILYRRHHKNLSLQPDPLHELHHREMYSEARQFFKL